MSSFTVLCAGQEFKIDVPDASSSQNLLEIVYLSGLFEPPPLCAGIALCGRCRMRFLPSPQEHAHILFPDPLPEDIKVLGPELVEQGWRLGCRHSPLPGTCLELPEYVKVQKDPPQKLKLKNSAEQSCFAVDFGSTSLHFTEIAQGAVFGSKTAVNPQIGSGSDIVSRLAFSGRKNGLSRLSALSRAALVSMLNSCTQNVELVCLAANPAMIYIILEQDISGLASSPYSLDYRGGSYENLPGLPKIWVAPLIGPFVGGDISAGYAALAWGRKTAYPFLLADMGTNGEFVLALSEHEAICASLPLGPALEGIGMRCGSEARPGVITGFKLSPAGLEPQFYPGSPSGSALGLSGTAYIALVYQLLRQGLIAESGLFASAPPKAPLAARFWKNLQQTDEGKVFQLAGTIHYLAGADVEELLKVKAAFSLALKLLLQKAGLDFAALQQVYIAGALGEHIDLAALEGLGFLPPGGSTKTLAVGNSSLEGAVLLCQREDLRSKLTAWAEEAQVLSLTEASGFQAAYTAEMRFKW